MFTVLDCDGDVLGVEISGGYTLDDFEKFKQAFEEAATGRSKVNILVRVDRLKIAESEFKALWKDASYALKHLSELRRIAVVADSRVLKALVELDNAILGDEAEGRQEKYFETADLDKAWAFVRG